MHYLTDPELEIKKMFYLVAEKVFTQSRHKQRPVNIFVTTAPQPLFCLNIYICVCVSYISSSQVLSQLIRILNTTGPNTTVINDILIVHPALYARSFIINVESASSRDELNFSTFLARSRAMTNVLLQHINSSVFADVFLFGVHKYPVCVLGFQYA